MTSVLPVDSRPQFPEQRAAHHLPVEQARRQDRDRLERLVHGGEVLGLDVLPLAEIRVLDLVGNDAVDDHRVHPVAEQRQVGVGATGLGDHHLLGVHHQPDADGIGSLVSSCRTPSRLRCSRSIGREDRGRRRSACEVSRVSSGRHRCAPAGAPRGRCARCTSSSPRAATAGGGSRPSARSPRPARRTCRESTCRLTSVRLKISSSPGITDSSSASMASTPAQFEERDHELLDVRQFVLQALLGVDLLGPQVVLR